MQMGIHGILYEKWNIFPQKTKKTGKNTATHGLLDEQKQKNGCNCQMLLL